MTILISSLPFVEGDFDQVFKIMDLVEDKENVGVEIFPVFKDDRFNELIQENMTKMQNCPISLHGPYFDIEHSAPKGSKEYDFAVAEFKEVLELGEKTNASHIVYHYNNKIITPDNKAETIHYGRENLMELNELAAPYNIPILFENTGVNIRQNNLFTEEEFIQEAKTIPNDVLLDVGHGNANGWDIANVIEQLQDKIKVYHLNNNKSHDDDHLRILEGDIDYIKLAELYKKYTPNADLVLEYGDEVKDDLSGIAEDVEFLQNNF